MAKDLNDLLKDLSAMGGNIDRATKDAQSKLGATATTYLKQQLNVAGRYAKGADKKTVRSKEGEYPRRQTGVLRNSIGFFTKIIRPGEILLEFGSNAGNKNEQIKYAKFVDKIRPYLERAFKPIYENMYAQFLKDAVNMAMGKLK